MLRTTLGLALLFVAGSAHAVSCGDTVTSDITLTADLHCTTGYTAFYVPTPGVTIDLNGHTLSGIPALVGLQVDAGLVTIRNGTIRGFWGGITGLRAHKMQIEGVVFEDMGMGVALNHTANAWFGNNRFTAIGTAISLRVPTAGYGAAGGHVIEANLFEKVRVGIDICGYGNRGVQIMKNEMADVADYGIHASDGSGGHHVADNIITEVQDTGIVLRASSDNEIVGNVIGKGRLGLAFIPEISGGCVTGPVLDPYVSYNKVYGNTIADLDGGLTLGLGTSPKPLVFKNNVHFNKIYNDITGIYFLPDAHDNDATGNAYAGTVTPIVDTGTGNSY